MSEERRDRLERISRQQVARRVDEAREDEAARPETDARLELARLDDGAVRAPTRAEVVLAAWRALVLAPFAAVGGVCIATLAPFAPWGPYQAALAGAGSLAASVFLLDLLLKTRRRHVEHVRVVVFARGELEWKVLVGATLCYVAAAAVIPFVLR